MNDHKAIPLPPLARLHELFSYDPISGRVSRRISRPSVNAGSAVGTLNSFGALIVRVDYRIYYVHRIAWALHYNEQPPPIIDHINRIRSDNRIANLRAATAQQNRQNSGGQRSSTSKSKGAHWSSLENKWRSSIKIDGKSHHLGWFQTKEAAAAAYRTAELAHYGDFARIV